MGENLEGVAKDICNYFGFTFIEHVGSGAFKETFHIEDENNLSQALKVFQSNNSSKRPQREIDAMFKCDHPNIGKLNFVSTFQYNNKEYLFIIEEFLAGGTLTKQLYNNGYLLPVQEVARIGLALIDAIKHIASAGLVHRDIKPDNVLFREDKATPVIVDFGLVRNLADESLTKTWLLQGPGTPLFASPEQLNNQKDLIDWRTDQYALGVLLSICCFGIHPYSYNNDSSNVIIERVAQRESLSDNFIANAKSTGLHSLIKMVSQWPVERFRTPQELFEAWNADINNLK